MLGSNSRFFYSSTEDLGKTKDIMVNFLINHNTKNSVIDVYIEAFDYFTNYPYKFDGATILKDVKVVPNLDIFAMLHDYIYVFFNTSVNIKDKTKSDFIYSKEMERCGLPTSVSWFRFSLLILTHFIFTPYELIRGKRMSNKQRSDFKKLNNKFK